MSDITNPQWGTFALVSYIPDPLGSFLHGLRQSLPGEDTPQPHVTILPPRPLKLPVDAASQQVKDILSRFSAFAVELSSIRSFGETKILYLDIGEGNRVLYDLHSALNAGDLAHDELFTFRPHLTLAGPIPEPDMKRFRRKAETAWHSVTCPVRFVMEEIVFLWMPSNGRPGEWVRLWSHYLKAAEKSAARATAAAAITTQTY